MIHDLKDARKPVDRAELHRLLDHLLDLRERTDPAVCDVPADVPLHLYPAGNNFVSPVRGKDELAAAALAMARSLTFATAGWAIHHRLGRVVNGGNDDDDLHEHHHEAAGIEAGRFTWSMEEDQAKVRAALCALLSFTAWPDGVRLSLSESIKALDHGQVDSLLAPAGKGGRGQAYSLAHIRLAALEYAYYRAGKGTALEVVRERVGGALSVSAETIKSWVGRDVPRILGADHVRDRTQNAYAAGELVRTLEDVPDRRAEIEASPGSEPWLLLLDAARYERTDLAALAVEYREHQRTTTAG